MWKSPSFAGSFAGITSFGQALAEKGIKISDKELIEVLHTVGTFLSNKKT